MAVHTQWASDIRGWVDGHEGGRVRNGHVSSLCVVLSLRLFPSQLLWNIFWLVDRVSSNVTYTIHNGFGLGGWTEVSLFSSPSSMAYIILSNHPILVVGPIRRMWSKNPRGHVACHVVIWRVVVDRRIGKR